MLHVVDKNFCLLVSLSNVQTKTELEPLHHLIFYIYEHCKNNDLDFLPVNNTVVLTILLSVNTIEI
jgi:hypothetical protein